MSGGFQPGDGYEGEMVDFRFSAPLRATHGGFYRIPCGKCGCQCVNIICPVQWPINEVALGCSMCGSIVEYLDNLLVRRERKVQKTKWAVHSGIAHELLPSNYEVMKQMILMGIENWLSDEDIAETVGVSIIVVRQVAKEVGY